MKDKFVTIVAMVGKNGPVELHMDTYQGLLTIRGVDEEAGIFETKVMSHTFTDKSMIDAQLNTAFATLRSQIHMALNTPKK